jgi:transposase, IS6 family
VLAVRWYLRFGLSYRDVEELLAERGVEVDHVTGHCCIWRSLKPASSTRAHKRHR